MQGTLDTYLQMRLLLSSLDIKILEEKGSVIGKISTTYDRTISLTIKIYLTEIDRPLLEDLPRDKRITTGYELYLSKRRLESIKEKRCVDAYSPHKSLRQVCISLESIF